MIRIIKLNRSDCCNIWRVVSCEKYLYLKNILNNLYRRNLSVIFAEN